MSCDEFGQDTEHHILALVYIKTRIMISSNLYISIVPELYDYIFHEHLKLPTPH